MVSNKPAQAGLFFDYSPKCEESSAAAVNAVWQVDYDTDPDVAETMTYAANAAVAGLVSGTQACTQYEH